ncbi:asparagine--tRNA ligase [Halobacteriovorax sp. GB3]|uniref:asparagine--tRNA ligase n=1 Tax=Halobacteriovorax sp. GB3 TaxID=2719615 RepID=UPI00235F7FA1|nr:asparagine--tRNA ligase [Halobacteriovorax sp. GB3]MDD0852818.1 asparagine--tRNA ligase [Halobacteriovorax sp. GB3]
MTGRLLIKKVFETEPVGQTVTVKGWIRSIRNSKKFSFMVLNDGSYQDSLQIVIDADLENYEEVASLLTGSSVSVTGKVVESGGKGQSVEMQAESIHIYGKTDESYPLQKKGSSLEFLREKAHLRARTNLFGAVFRIRHELAQATHKFFSDRGFYYLNSPIITAVDGEGAGEMFKVTTLDLENLPKDDKGNVDYSKDYFGKDVSLCVTGQLEGECHALGLGSVYTFGPTFRSENSNTKRHLSEFWMIEPEVAFADLDEVADLAADYIKFLVAWALEKCEKELNFIWGIPFSDVDKSHRSVLENVRDSEFLKITYTEAVEILSKTNVKFEYPTEWGKELQTEHEKYLTEEHFKKPVIVTDYPADCKAFYMKQNEDGKTVRAMDVLVPGIGEIIGGSQREEDLDKLIKKMDEDGMEKEGYWWYLELRKFGTAPHSGFGLGFERAIMYITGMPNIRDVIAFPRTPKSCDF